jgi:hypothetical protein
MYQEFENLVRYDLRELARLKSQTWHLGGGAGKLQGVTGAQRIRRTGVGFVAGLSVGYIIRVPYI